MNNKGQSTFKTVGTAMVAILILALIAISVIFIANVMDGENVLAPETLYNGKFQNQTIILNKSSQAVGGSGTPSACLNLRSPTLANIVMTNQTHGTIISAGNYSVSGCSFTNTTTFAGFTVNVTADYYSIYDSDAVAIVGNTSIGVTGFFTTVPTMFTVLGITAIIVIIGLLVIAIRAYSSRDSMAGI